MQPGPYGPPSRPSSTPAPGDVRVAGAPLGPSSDAPHGPDVISDADAASPRPSPERPAPKGLRLPVKLAAAAGAAVVLAGGGAIAGLLVGGGEEKTTVRPTPLADAPKAPDPQVLAAQQRQLNLERAYRAAARDARKEMVLEAKGHTPTPTPTPSTGAGESGGGTPYAGNPVPAGEAQRIAKAMLPEFGFDPNTQFGCLVELWQRESGWRVNAQSPSGAYGIPQALPGSKMASAGPDWRTNPRTQIKWGLGYIKGRYGTPCGAWGHFQRNGWY